MVRPTTGAEAAVAAPDRDAYDLFAIGFGPSNLALAIAVREHNETAQPERRLRLGILERKTAFGWHRGMLLDGATMQVSFLKDLATMRNPSSRFSFLAYLHERARLVAFINHKTLFPTRIEFHDYLEWAASGFADDVEYGIEAIDVRPVQQDGIVVALDVSGRPADSNGHGEVVRRTRNLVLGTGIVPSLPRGVVPSERVCHSSELLDRLETPAWASARRFAVIGAGQSAAEVTAYLHERFRTAEIHAVFARYGFSPSDDSPFANRVFDPAAVDEFFDAPESVKDSFYAYHANTNYSVVDPELIDELYRRHYTERVRGTSRLHLHHLSKVAEMATASEHVDLEVMSLVDDKQWRLEADAVVFATGYTPMDPARVLGDTARLCKLNGSGRFQVERDYRVTTTANVRCGIFLQGGTEHTHGLSSSLLSTTAVRAGEIVAAVSRDALGRTTGTEHQRVRP